MKNKYPFVLFFVFIFTSGFAQAQSSPDSTLTSESKKEYASPGVLGMGKSKGIIVNYEWQPSFGIMSEEQASSTGAPGLKRDGTVRRNNKLDIKAYFPLVNKSRIKVVGGFNYFFEEFNFEYPLPKYSFYENLEDKNLKTIAGQLVMLRPINETNFYVMRIKGELNGDYTSKKVAVADYLKTTLEFLYGWKKSPTYSYGFGAQLGYALGRRRLYPAFLYNRTFNSKWGIESILPANADIRYNASEKSLWFAGFSVDGAAYNLNFNNPSFNNLETMELRRSEIRARVRWEREIYDFLWLGAEAGYRQNFTFEVSDKESGDGYMFFDKRDAPIIDNKLKGAPLFSLEIFLVPPRRFLKP